MAEDGRKDATLSREEIGQYLKRVREEKGISLKTVAEETKIRVRYLQALEEGDYAALPGNVYARGFLRSYARFLGVELPRQQATVSPKAHGEEPEGRTVVIKKKVPAIQAQIRPAGHFPITFAGDCSYIFPF